MKKLAKVCLGAGLGAVVGTVATGFHVGMACTAVVSYPVVGTLAGALTAKPNNMDTLTGAVIGGVTGLVLIPFAPLCAVSALALDVPGFTVIGGVVGSQV